MSAERNDDEEGKVESVEALVDGVFAHVRRLLLRNNVGGELGLREEPYKTPSVLHGELFDDSKGMLEFVETVMKNSVNTCSPMFMARLYTGAEVAGVMAELISNALNTSAGAWDIAPVFALVEKKVLSVFVDLVGWKPPARACFTPGGSIANLYALYCARETAGAPVEQLCAVASVQGHYSFDKACRMAGIRNIRLLKSWSELGDTLADITAQGMVPFYVHATSGTTVMGDFDPLASICDAAAPYHSWVHCDASWGGGVLFSNKHRPRLFDGVERCQSVSICAHKLLGVPLHATVIIFQQGDVLQKCFSAGTVPPYIYHQDDLADDGSSFDSLGRDTFQCSRPTDCFKTYMVLRAVGHDGIAAKVEHAMSMGQELARLISARRGYRLVGTPSFANVCFWYDGDDDFSGFEAEGALFLPKSIDALDRANRYTHTIRAIMLRRGRAITGYSSLPECKEAKFLRVICVSPHVSTETLQFLLEEIEACAKIAAAGWAMK